MNTCNQHPVHTLLGALDAFEREYVPSGLAETAEWKRVRRVADHANHTLRLAATALRDEGHLTLAAEAQAQVPQ